MGKYTTFHAESAWECSLSDIPNSISTNREYYTASKSYQKCPFWIQKDNSISVAILKCCIPNNEQIYFKCCSAARFGWYEQSLLLHFEKGSINWFKVPLVIHPFVHPVFLRNTRKYVFKCFDICAAPRLADGHGMLVTSSLYPDMGGYSLDLSRSGDILVVWAPPGSGNADISQDMWRYV